MKNLPHSFRTRLFGSFLIASLIPMLLCSLMLLQVFRLRMSTLAKEESNDQLNQIVTSLDDLYEDFYQATLILQASPSVSASLADGAESSNPVYNELYNATEGLRSTARFDLCDSQGTSLYSTAGTPLETELSPNWGLLYAAGQTGDLVFFQVNGDEGSSSILFQGAARILDDDGNTAGFLVISMTRDHIYQLLKGLYGTQNVLLLNSYWHPVYASLTSLADDLAPLLRQQLLTGASLNQVESGFSYYVAYQEDLGLYVILRQAQPLTTRTQLLLNTVTGSCALVCIALSILMGLRLSRQMFQPIQRLRGAMGQVSENNLNTYVEIDQKDELGQLAQHFNGMVATIKRNQEQLIKNQQELNEAQIRMLQAQLNPHFLCNTLDTMKWISKINQVPQVALMSTDLADILRFCISPDEFVPLHREMENLHRYMEIQSIRLSGHHRFESDLPTELEDCLVPKMILQPIVENAVLHGLDGVENGIIQVRVRTCEDNLLHISVTDNGCGIPPELEGPYGQSKGGNKEGHLGLYNVDTILKKHYGPDFGLYLKRRTNEPGTEVTAMLTHRKEETDPC